MPKRFREFERGVRASRRMRTCHWALMLRDASQRASAAGAAALAFRCDAPQHEGKARSINRRLCEMTAGAVSLFPACYLQ
jgi:hypothetical protein